MTRYISMKWTQRNIERMYRWLNLTSDWRGFFERNGEPMGYKIASMNIVTFVFFNR